MPSRSSMLACGVGLWCYEDELFGSFVKAGLTMSLEVAARHRSSSCNVATYADIEQ